eukprot:1980171-Rhodomonas_salina.1
MVIRTLPRSADLDCTLRMQGVSRALRASTTAAPASSALTPLPPSPGTRTPRGGVRSWGGVWRRRQHMRGPRPVRATSLTPTPSSACPAALCTPTCALSSPLCFFSSCRLVC